MHLLAIVILGSLIYSGTLGVPFLLDDKPLIVNNPIIKDMDYVLHPFSAMDQKDYGMFWRRYVSFASLALNYSLHGLKVSGYHAVNISLHLLNALMLYVFVLALSRTPALVNSWFSGKTVRWAALLSSLIFVAHPVNTETVNYICQRTTLLSFFFYMCSITIYVKMRGSVEAWQRYGLYLLCILTGVLAVKSKENALTLFAMVGFCELLFFSGLLKRRLLFVCGLLIPVGVWIVSLYDTGLTPETLAFGSSGDTERLEASTFDADYLNLGEKRTTYLLTQIRVMATYLRLILLPVRQNFLYDYPAINSFSSLPFLLSLTLVMTLIGLSVFSLYKFRRTKGFFHSLIAFAVFWFFIGLSVESSIVPLPLYLTEYRLYLPAIGFYILGSVAFVRLMSRVTNVRLKTTGICGVAVLLMVLSIATYKRNETWASALSLWEDVVRKSPASIRGHNNLGVALSKEGRMSDALEHYRRTLELQGIPLEPLAVSVKIASERSKKKKLAGVFANMGEAYKGLDKLEEAIKSYKAAIAIDPLEPKYHYNVGNIYMKTAMTQDAVYHYEKALEVNDNADYHNNLSVAYRLLGNHKKALEHLDKAKRLR